jgi:hypothetical protein
LPQEGGGDQLLERPAAEKMLEGPAGRGVTDDENPLASPTHGHVIEEPADAGDRLSPAFASLVRDIEMSASRPMELGHRHTVAFAVVALSEPPVVKDRDRRARKGDSNGLDGAVKVRREDGGDPIVATALTYLGCLLAPDGRELARQPTGRDSALVVFAGGVRLENDFRRRHWLSASRTATAVGVAEPVVRHRFVDCSAIASLSPINPVDRGHQRVVCRFASIGTTDAGRVEPAWYFTKVPEPKRAKNRVHVDLVSPDPSTVDELIKLGASLVGEHELPGGSHRWTVMQDPEGNEFCIGEKSFTGWG